MEKDFITVKTFTFPSDVAIVQSFMEMEDIEVFIKNMTIHRLVGPICDIEMQVKAQDYDRAKIALIDGGFAKPEDFQQ